MPLKQVRIAGVRHLHVNRKPPSTRLPPYTLFLLSHFRGALHKNSLVNTRGKKRKERKKERNKDGEHVLPLLRVHRPSEYRDGGELGPLPEACRPRPPLLQPLRWRVPCRRPFHPRLLPRRPHRDQDQGHPLPVPISSS